MPSFSYVYICYNYSLYMGRDSERLVRMNTGPAPRADFSDYCRIAEHARCAFSRIRNTRSTGSKSLYWLSAGRSHSHQRHESRRCVLGSRATGQAYTAVRLMAVSASYTGLSSGTIPRSFHTRAALGNLGAGCRLFAHKPPSRSHK
jgi:hypothetical protein